MTETRATKKKETTPESRKKSRQDDYDRIPIISQITDSEVLEEKEMEEQQQNGRSGQDRGKSGC